MWNTGYALEKLPELADINGERTKAFLAKLAKELDVHIVGGALFQQRKATNFIIRCIPLIVMENLLENTARHIFSV